MATNVGQYGKFNIGIWYDSNITVYQYMHAATSCLAWSLSLPLGLLFAFFTSECRWGWWTFRCESRFDVLPLFTDTGFLHNRQISASWTFGLPSTSASNPKYIQTADFVPLDFETRPSLSLSLVPFSLVDVGLALTVILSPNSHGVNFYACALWTSWFRAHAVYHYTGTALE